MKKILLAVTAALAITGCSQNEEFESTGLKSEIVFNTIVSKTTRAAVTDITGLRSSGFTVYAYNTGANIISSEGLELTNSIIPEGLAVTSSGENWIFTGTYYWPLNDYVQFFAYATDDAVTEYSVSAGLPTLKYTIASDVKSQKDFVVAQANDKKNMAEALQLTFTHALTQVNFSVIGADNSTYKISSVSIEGVAESGVYSFKTGKWTAGSETTGKYAYTIASNASVSSSTTAVQLDQQNGILMLMPQAMTDAAQIKISYSVYNGETEISKSENTVIPLKETAAWEAGKKVRYTLKLANNAATMTFAPEVGPWANDDDTPVNKDVE